MIALQWSLKGTLPAKHTQTTHSLAPSSSPLCLSLSRLSQEPRGPLGYAAPNTRTALGLFELNILLQAIKVTGLQMKRQLCLSVNAQIYV